MKASLLWGLVGGLSFLVLAQGYELLAEPGVSFLAEPGVSFLAKIAVATGVFGGATAASYVAAPRL